MRKIFFTLYVSVVFFSCKKESSNPSNLNQVLTTTAANGITISSALTGGFITDDGGAAITARGVCWGTTSNPTLANNRTTDGSGTGEFKSAITGLVNGTTYYIRAYCINSIGTSYGEEEIYTASGPFVYVAGLENTEAKLWKNGVATTLNSASEFAEAKSVFVTETAVYVAGYVNSGTNDIATVWKNGDPVSLTDGSTNAVALSVFVSGTDVFAAGYEYNGAGITVAKVWKNSISTSLTDGTYSGYAASVFVSGSDVYVTGNEYNAGGNSFAKTWKNGVGESLSNGLTLGNGNSIIISGTDVYVGGVTNGTGTIWKNGVPTGLTIPGPGNGSSANSLYISGTDVYACGWHITGGIALTRIWKNGVATTLTTVSNAGANSVYVYGTAIYVCGYESTGSGTVSTAKLWKNGVATDLTNGTTGAGAYGIFVK